MSRGLELPIEVYLGVGRPRRRFTPEQIAQIVQDSHDSSVAEAAFRHGVSRARLFAWRRAASGRAAVEASADPGLPFDLELEVNGVTVRVARDAARGTVDAVMEALRVRG